MSAHEHLNDYVDGRLPAEQAAELERRLEEDQILAEALAEMRLATDALRGLPRVSAPAGLRAAIAAKLDAEKAASMDTAGEPTYTVPVTPMGLRLDRSLAAAGLLTAMLVGGSLLMINDHPQPAMLTARHNPISPIDGRIGPPGSALGSAFEAKSHERIAGLERPGKRGGAEGKLADRDAGDADEKVHKVQEHLKKLAHEKEQLAKLGKQMGARKLTGKGYAGDAGGDGSEGAQRKTKKLLDALNEDAGARPDGKGSKGGQSGKAGKAGRPVPGGKKSRGTRAEGVGAGGGAAGGMQRGGDAGTDDAAKPVPKPMPPKAAGPGAAEGSRPGSKPGARRAPRKSTRSQNDVEPEAGEDGKKRVDGKRVDESADLGDETKRAERLRRQAEQQSARALRKLETKKTEELAKKESDSKAAPKKKASQGLGRGGKKDDFKAPRRKYRDGKAPADSGADSGADGAPADKDDEAPATSKRMRSNATQSPKPEGKPKANMPKGSGDDEELEERRLAMVRRGGRSSGATPENDGDVTRITVRPIEIETRHVQALARLITARAEGLGLTASRKTLPTRRRAQKRGAGSASEPATQELLYNNLTAADLERLREAVATLEGGGRLKARAELAAGRAGGKGKPAAPPTEGARSGSPGAGKKAAKAANKAGNKAAEPAGGAATGSSAGKRGRNPARGGEKGGGSAANWGTPKGDQDSEKESANHESATLEADKLEAAKDRKADAKRKDAAKKADDRRDAQSDAQRQQQLRELQSALKVLEQALEKRGSAQARYSLRIILRPPAPEPRKRKAPRKR